MPGRPPVLVVLVNDDSVDEYDLDLQRDCGYSLYGYYDRVPQAHDAHWTGYVRKVDRRMT